MREFMVPVAAAASPDTSVGEAHRLLREHGTTHVPVLEDGLLVGIVSERDLLRAQSDALPIRDVMTRMVYVLSPETLVSRAARAFRRHDVPVLPVLAGRALVGLVRAIDVLETAWDHTRGPA